MEPTPRTERVRLGLVGSGHAGHLPPFSVVCAPGQRYHPMIIAQGAATLAELFPGRFRLALGSREALNERVLGEPWPHESERYARLLERVDIRRAHGPAGPSRITPVY
jgi:coenzyme F420-dependent glucose-6-phosphate dehydrogenase